MAEITLRVPLGRPLTYQEVDDNFRSVQELTLLAQSFALTAQDASTLADAAKNEAIAAKDEAWVASGSAALDAQRAEDAADRAEAIAGFDGLHNTLAGRDTPNAHDASAIGFKQRGDGAVNSDVETQLRKMPMVTDYEVLGKAITAAIAGDFVLGVTSDLTVRVPSDAPDLQTAFDRLTPVNRQCQIEVLIETGHALSKGLYLEGDFRQFIITSEDSHVLLSGSFQPVVNPSSEPYLIVGVSCFMPILSILIDAEDMPPVVGGFNISMGSVGRINSGCGVINSGGFGLGVSTSRVTATGANFSGAAWGNRITTNSFLHAPFFNGSNVKNSSYPGGSTAGLDVSRGSVVNITSNSSSYANLTNCAGRGFAARRSFVSAQYVDASGSGLGFVIAEGCSGTIRNGRANDCVQQAILVSGSTLEAADFFGERSGYTQGGQFTGGAKINLSNSRIYGVNRGVYFSGGSNANLSGGNFTQDGTTESNSDIVITGGSVISAHNVTGGASIDDNTLHRNGIIFR